MLGDRIRERRVELGYTQAMLASKLGVSASSIGMYESGRRTPDADLLRQMCVLFHTTSDWLLYGGEVGEDGLVDIQTFVSETRERLSRLRGRLCDPEPDGRLRLITDDEVDMLADSIEVGVEVALRHRKLK